MQRNIVIPSAECSLPLPCSETLLLQIAQNGQTTSYRTNADINNLDSIASCGTPLSGFAYQVVLADSLFEMFEFVKNARLSDFQASFLNGNVVRKSLQSRLDSLFSSIPAELKEYDRIQHPPDQDDFYRVELNLIYQLSQIILHCPAIITLDILNAPMIEPELFSTSQVFASQMTLLVRHLLIVNSSFRFVPTFSGYCIFYGAVIHLAAAALCQSSEQKRGYVEAVELHTAALKSLSWSWSTVTYYLDSIQSLKDNFGDALGLNGDMNQSATNGGHEHDLGGRQINT